MHQYPIGNISPTGGTLFPNRDYLHKNKHVNVSKTYLQQWGTRGVFKCWLWMEGGIEWAGNELMFTLVNEKLISRSLFRFHKQGHNSDNFEQPDAVCVFVKEFSFSLIFCVVCFWVSWALILYLPTCDKHRFKSTQTTSGGLRCL